MNNLKRTKVWIVSELFYPDQASTGYIMTNIAEALAQDHEVHVICGPAGYDKLNDGNATLDFHFKIHRIGTLNLNKNHLITRIVRLFILSLGMFFRGLIWVGKNDTVFIVTNPAFVIPFYSIITWIKGNRLLILVHDVFPENLIPAKIIRSNKNLGYRFIKQIFDWSYRQASTLIVLGSDMLEILSAKTNDKVPIKVIENWANVDAIAPTHFKENELIIRYGLDDKIVFCFAGNLGRMQGLERLLQIIKKIDNPLVHFLFIGDGALLTTLRAEVTNQQLTNVTFAGAMCRDDQNVFLNACHFGLVTLAPDLYGLGVPSKSYNILAASKPILFIGNKQTEISKMVRTHDCGYTFDEWEVDSLVDFFNRLDSKVLIEAERKGAKGRELVMTRYAKDKILDRFKNLMND